MGTIFFSLAFRVSYYSSTDQKNRTTALISGRPSALLLVALLAASLIRLRHTSSVQLAEWQKVVIRSFSLLTMHWLVHSDDSYYYYFCAMLSQAIHNIQSNIILCHMGRVWLPFPSWWTESLSETTFYRLYRQIPTTNPSSTPVPPDS